MATIYTARTLVGILSVGGGYYFDSNNPNQSFTVEGWSLEGIKNGSSIQVILREIGSSGVVTEVLNQEGGSKLSSAFICESVPVGNVFGSYGIVGSAGPFTCTFTSNPGLQFQFVNGNQIAVLGILTVGVAPIAFTITDGTTTINAVDTINVISIAPFFQVGQVPFVNTSPINVLLQTGVAYTPMLWPTPYTESNYFMANRFSLCFPKTTDPVCAIVLPGGRHGPPGTVYLTLPTGFTGNSADTDHEAVAIYPDGTCYNFYELVRTSDSAATAIDYGITNVLTGTGLGNSSLSPPNKSAGVTAIWASNMAGACFKEDFANGPIQHKLAFNGGNFNFITPGSFLPALGGDGQTSDGAMFEGQYIGIPPGTAMPGGLSPYGVALFNCLVSYGALCNDSAGSQGFQFAGFPGSSPNSYHTAASWQAADQDTLIADQILLIPLCQKIGPFLDGFVSTAGLQTYSGPVLGTANYGGPLMDIKRASDSTIKGIGYIGINQAIDSSSISAFCSGTSGTVNEWYSHLFSSLSFAAVAVGPTVYTGGVLQTISSVPAMYFDGTAHILQATGNTIPTVTGQFGSCSSQIYLNAVVQIPDHSANYGIFGADVSGGLELRINSSTGFVQLMTNTGTIIAASATAVAVNTPTIIEVTYFPTIYNGGAGQIGKFQIWQNGVSTATGTNSVALVAGNLLVGAGASAGDYFNGLISEIIYSNNCFTAAGGALFSTKAQFSIVQSQKERYGIS